MADEINDRLGPLLKSKVTPQSVRRSSLQARLDFTIFMLDVTVVNHETRGGYVNDLSGSKLELRHGPGQPSTWEQHGSIRQLYDPVLEEAWRGYSLRPRDMVNIRSHRPQTSMHWIGDMVAVPFIWATGAAGLPLCPESLRRSLMQRPRPVVRDATS
jgi:hypothetical protein